MTKPIRIEHLAPCALWWGGATRNGRVESEVAWKVTVNDVKERGYNLDVKNPHVLAVEHQDPEELLRHLDAAESEAADLLDRLNALLEEALLR